MGFAKMKARLKDVRLAFGVLWTPQNNQGETDPQKKAWSARFIIDPVKHKDLVAEIESKIVEVARAQPKWAGTIQKGADAGKLKADVILAKLYASGDVCFSKEEYTNKAGDVYDGFEGMYHLGARTSEFTAKGGKNAPPTIVDVRGLPVKEGEDGAPYNGCRVYADVDIWAQDNNWGQAIRASLSGVQFYRDGDAFGGARPTPVSAYENLADTGEEGDYSDLT